jgi:hypothetical protein
MDTKIKIVRTFYLNYKELFNRYYTPQDRMIMYVGFLMATIPTTVIISSLDISILMRFYLASNSFFIFLLLIKYINKVDVHVLRTQYHIYTKRITKEDIYALRKREFEKLFNGFMLAEPRLDMVKLKRNFEILGAKSSNDLRKEFLAVGAFVLTSPIGIVAFLYSDVQFEIKWLVAKILIASSFIVVYSMVTVYMFLSDKITTNATQDKQIGEWIDEKFQSKEK